MKRKVHSRTKLHPRWDGPFIIHDLTDKNTYQLATRSGFILRHLYNREQLSRYHASDTDTDLWYASAALQRNAANSAAAQEKALRELQRQNPIV